MPLMWSISRCLIAAIKAVAIRSRDSSGRKINQRRTKVYYGVSEIAHGHIRSCVLPEAQDTCYTEILFGFASVMTIVQGILGTVVLSFLLFVSFLDASPNLVRFETSAALCNILLRLELAGLKCKLEEEVDSIGKDKTRHFQLVESLVGI